MNSNIWHSNDERPDNNTIIAYPVGDVIMGGNIYEHTDWDLLKRNVKLGWIYQHDMQKLFNQSEELERYKNALDVINEFAESGDLTLAEQTLKNIIKRLKIANIINGTDKGE